MLIGLSACAVLPFVSPSDSQSGSKKPSRYAAIAEFVGNLPALMPESKPRAQPQSLTIQVQPETMSRRDMLVQTSALLAGQTALQFYSRRRRSYDASSAAYVAPLAAVSGKDNSQKSSKGSKDLLREKEKMVEIYFGAGGFWQVQRAFIRAEERILGRTGDATTSGEGRRPATARAGYAGGKRAGKVASRPGQELVCYHNGDGIADYADLGYAEVVSVKVPESSVGDFAEEYARLVRTRRDRRDTRRKGGEYRSLIGLPGGVDSTSFAAVSDALRGSLGFFRGTGSDGDTLGPSEVWLYDTENFPFYQAEVYQQYHFGRMSSFVEEYNKKQAYDEESRAQQQIKAKKDKGILPDKYDNLRRQAYDDSRLFKTGCPDIV